MTQFMSGKLPPQNNATTLFAEAAETSVNRHQALCFSPSATAVFDAGRELWKYYHAQKNANVNASLYDIRAHFQGRNDKGRMNSKSHDEHYGQLIRNLRDALKDLAEEIKPKIYEYEFLNE